MFVLYTWQRSVSCGVQATKVSCLISQRNLSVIGYRSSVDSEHVSSLNGLVVIAECEQRTLRIPDDVHVLERQSRFSSEIVCWHYACRTARRELSDQANKHTQTTHYTQACAPAHARAKEVVVAKVCLNLSIRLAVIRIGLSRAQNRPGADQTGLERRMPS